MSDTARHLRIYLDTSVFGGVFDMEFAHASKRLFDRISHGVFDPVISIVVAEEIGDAPPRVQQLYRRVAQTAELREIDDATLALRDAYRRAVGR